MQPKKILSTGTTFKILVYWIYKKGFPRVKYSQEEINCRPPANRKYIPSFDYFPISSMGEIRNVTDHKQALEKQYKFLKIHFDFYTAFIIWNTEHEGKPREIAVAKFVDGKCVASRPAHYRVGGKFLDDIIIAGLGGKEIKMNSIPLEYISDRSQEQININRNRTFAEISAEQKEIQRKKDEAAHQTALIEFQKMYGGHLPNGKR